MYEIQQFFKQIHNLIRWFPIIWKDKDWDDHYIFEILKFKLKNQAEYIGKKNRHMSAKRDAEIMMLCVRLMEKVQDEYYGMEYHDYYKSNIKFIPSISHPGSYEMEEELISEHYDNYFKKYPRIYKQVTGKDKHEVAFQMARINGERAHKLLFTILEQNIRKWWD